MTDKEMAYIKRTGELSRACGLMMGAIEAVINWPKEVSAAHLRKLLNEVHELTRKSRTTVDEIKLTRQHVSRYKPKRDKQKRKSRSPEREIR